MFRALLWKEWRQLALIRWGGIVLGALIPVAFMIGAELAKRGLLPTVKLNGYVPRDLMFELLPATLALGVWPLIALMSAAQAFTGDRAAGSEPFLLERPVPRTTVWCARLAASLGSLVVTIVATIAVGAAASAPIGAPPSIGWSRWAILGALGCGVALLAYLGGLVAASLLPSPMGAVLLGALLGGLPAALAAGLTFFQYARLGEDLLGVGIPVLLLPAYLVASWLAFCRGEPAGNGRVRRAVVTLGSALAGVVLLFLILAPILLRLNAARGMHFAFSAPQGGHAFVGSSGNWGVGGWIVDTVSGRKRAFLSPPLGSVAWSPDGSQLAVQTSSGPLGSISFSGRIEVRSATDGKIRRTIALADDVVVTSMEWAKAGLVTSVWQGTTKKTGQSEIQIFDPITGAVRPTGFVTHIVPAMHLVQPTADGQVFVSVMDDEKDVQPGGARPGHRLHPIDVAAARVGPPMADASGRPLQFVGWGPVLSPAGRFALVGDDGDDLDARRLVDLREGSGGRSVPAPRGASWLDGDRMVWYEILEHKTRMFVGTPGEAPKAVREWHDAEVGIRSSPDRRTVFISVIPAFGAPSVAAGRPLPDPARFEGSVPQGSAPEELVYVPDEDRVVSLGHPFSDRPNDQRYSVWAGAKTLARIAPGVVYFEDIDRPGVLRFVIGGSSDLE